VDEVPTYATPAEVELVGGVGPTGSIVLTDAIMNALIEHAEAEIAGWLNRLAVAGDTNDVTLKAAVIELTIGYISTRLRMVNVKPGTLTLGEKTFVDNVDNNIAEKKMTAREMVDAYALIKKGRPFAATSVDPEATVVTADHEMGTMHLDQQKVPEYHDRASELNVDDC
jgi:hypothetical protein